MLFRLKIFTSTQSMGLKYSVRLVGTHQLDPFSTSSALLRTLYLGSITSTQLIRPQYFDLFQIWIYYWLRSTGQSTVLVEVKVKNAMP